MCLRYTFQCNHSYCYRCNGCMPVMSGYMEGENSILCSQQGHSGQADCGEKDQW